MDISDKSVVYGLRHNARCLTSVKGSSLRNKFLAGTRKLKESNEIHLVDFDEEEMEVRSLIYRHPPEIWSLETCPSDEQLFFSVYGQIKDNQQQFAGTLWRMDNTNVLNTSAAEAQDLPLKELVTLQDDRSLGYMKKVLWNPTGDHSKVVSLHEQGLHQWSLESGYSGAKIIDSTGVSNEGRFNCATWSPHEQQIVTGRKGSVLGWDMRNIKSPTFNIKSAHTLNVRCVDFNTKREHILATGGDDCKVKFWDIRNTKAHIKEICNHTHWVWSVSFNRFHDQLVLSSSSDCQVNLERVDSISSSRLNETNTRFDEASSMHSAAYEYNTQDLLVFAYEDHEESVYSAVWSNADPWILASLSNDGRLVINFVPREEKYKILQ
ncbi:WD40 repeat-like protein [Basidiobolus meristosporus CBS 931.73]|uniref:WD40 repeat-like protein n=1 Tax=Basidiobolus meristosporus CBS 931.73 TaxID=1314790 RepID=A0A1Y1XPZ7_9FUNG|nr:WD40 repeat-like protein [Basidiobolus meristosporus CBS 931.73]|eukprot:ORX87735.1 WD40 repeat-like protein [Basidiobolus meristosporus CBS 931.73]